MTKRTKISVVAYGLGEASYYRLHELIGFMHKRIDGYRLRELALQLSSMA